jgi:ABC-type antimicrobial peptide transport system permease subunit
MIDESLAKQFWPGQDPVGRRILEVQMGTMLTIIGVVGRVKHDALDSDPRIVFYLPHAQRPTRAMSITLRTGQDPETVLESVKRELQKFDPGLPMYAVSTMDHLLDQSLARRRFTMALLTVFSVVALALAAIGVYGVMSFLVSQGTREIGIRVAMGATQAGIVRFVIRRGMAVSLTGVVLGIVAAFASTRLMRSLLYGVTPTDVLTFASIPLLLGLVALVASYIPARRAARVEPADSLRQE